MIVIIDNYDSFTYNLYQYIGMIDENVKVFRNNKITIEELNEMDISHIIISPGPKYPKDAGISMAVIKAFYKKAPILGVCLGHQSIGEVFGGRTIYAQNIMHGKLSTVTHNREYIFENVDNPLKVARYHSLVIDKNNLPDELEIIAQSNDDGEIMAVKHKKYPVFGLQFHPESMASEYGIEILRNFITCT